MKIKVIKKNIHLDMWYNNHIGEIFDVFPTPYEFSGQYKYQIKFKKNFGGRTVNAADIIIFDRELKLKRLLNETI